MLCLRCWPRLTILSRETIRWSFISCDGWLFPALPCQRKKFVCLNLEAMLLRFMSGRWWSRNTVFKRNKALYQTSEIRLAWARESRWRSWLYIDVKSNGISKSNRVERKAIKVLQSITYDDFNENPEWLRANLVVTSSQKRLLINDLRSKRWVVCRWN